MYMVYFISLYIYIYIYIYIYSYINTVYTHTHTHTHTHIYIYIYIYTHTHTHTHTHTQSWPKILAPLANMIKEGFENVSALFILLIFYLKKSQKSNLSLENKNLKWGEI